MVEANRTIKIKQLQGADISLSVKPDVSQTNDRQSSRVSNTDRHFARSFHTM